MSREFRRKTVQDRVKTFVHQGEAEMPLMEFLAANVPDRRRADLKIWLKYGHVEVNGLVEHNVHTPVKPGDHVALNFSRPFVVFKNPRLKIVYEDDDILVVNKGYGLLSVGTGTNPREETAYSLLRDYLKQKDPRNKIFVVHRLDKQTSGLMLFAKSPEAQEALQHNWNNMILERRYVAVVEGHMQEQSGVIRSNLDETSQFEVYSTPDRDRGKPALTRYRVLSRGKGYSLVEFSLDTGRKNQIRVHAKDLGHPISGDKKYGAKASPLHRLALHAYTLSFAHPMTRKYMNFELPVPSRFAGLAR